MAAGQDTTLRVEDDPSTASDALSLHTIAEADAYTTQEQEDADFALALAVDEQESQRYARTQRIIRGQGPNQINEPLPAQTETPPPYRDDPDAVLAAEEQDGNLPPYRDDPDAMPVEGEADEAAAEPAKRQRAFIRILRKLFKTWLCCLLFSTIISIVFIVVVLVLVFAYGTKVDDKEAAWLASGSSDYNLKLAKLYPVLEKGTKDTCKTAWDREVAGLPCHRMILSSAWDNGDAEEVSAAGANPFVYSEAVCTSQCRASIRSMEAPLAKACQVRTDRFDFTSYGDNGRAYFEKGKIEEGPVHVAKNLLVRYDRLCARPQRTMDRTVWKTCAADLYMNWGIVDSKNEAHLNGLDHFMEQTLVKKTIPAKRQIVTSLTSSGINKTCTVSVPSRNVGPGAGETDCGFCTLNWLERKMRSFEFGQILDPASGEALGLSEFRTKMGSAIRRCSASESRRALSRVDQKWSELGWWCGGKPCRVDKPSYSEETKVILHGWPLKSEVLSGLRKIMEKKDAPKKALQAVHDGMRDMPCGVGFQESTARNEFLHNEHIVKRICSDECRNALDRLQNQHGALFATLVNDPQYGHIFQYPAKAIEQVDKVCLSSTPNTILQASENLCAPGYAAVGHPEWIFDSPLLHRPGILAAFSASINDLAARLPHRTQTPKTDPESVRIQSKKLAESACNTCAGGIFIGLEPDWKKTVNEYLDDGRVNGTEYVEVAKKGWLTCAKMYGVELNERQKRMMWRRYGLDRFD